MYLQISARNFAIFVFALVSFVMVGLSPAIAKNDFEALSEEQAAFATRFEAFLERMDSLYFGTIEELNGTPELQTETMSTDTSDYLIKVARGLVIEKGGRTINITKKPTRDFQRENLWSRYYLLDVHPKTPLVGMLHAAIVIQFFPDDTATIAGFLDVLQTAHKDEDLDYMRTAMNGVFEKYGRDPTSHRKLSDEGHDEDDPMSVDNSRRRKTTQVGGSFYGSPLMQVNEENFGFMTEAYETMLTSYLDVVAQRKDDTYTAEDLAAQDAMRKNWLEDRFFSDPYTTSVSPYEAWSLYSLPPTVKF